MAIKPIYPLTSLYLYLSDRCNLNCSHCWISPKSFDAPETPLPLAVLENAIQQARPLGLTSVKLTGGEPLLHPHWKELIAMPALDGVNISVETNGTLIDDVVVEVFQNPTVDQVSVSIDAASAEIHDGIRGRRGAFQRAVAGVEALSRAGVNTQIIFTLQRQNAQEMDKVIALCKGLGAASLKVNHLLPCGRGKDAFEKKQNLDLSELKALYHKVEADHPRSNGFTIVFDLPIAFRSLKSMTQGGISECRVLNILSILANGDLSICGIGQVFPNLRMGNIYKDEIAFVWENNQILHSLRNGLPGKLEGACGGCIFKFQCLGGCRANAYALTGNFFAPYFLCDALRNSGQFPSSRRVD
jgi:SynChlorMet cassette radical SAM/SPASM protein ScmF